jgi:hypothetical protein
VQRKCCPITKLLEEQKRGEGWSQSRYGTAERGEDVEDGRRKGT